MVLCISTLRVSLPSTTAAVPRRPCEAITMRSHPCRLAVAMIAWYDWECWTWSVSQATPVAAASVSMLSSHLAAKPAARCLYSSGVSAT